jgi:nucleotide-binding universal stress UspA family protein
MSALTSLPGESPLTTSRTLTRGLQVFSVALTLLLGVTASAKKVEPGAPAVFTDSSAAGLAGTKRVAITNVTVAFQASTLDRTSPNGMFSEKQTTSAALVWPDLDPQLAAVITDEIYAQLKAELQANGFEVVPEATVLASPTYQKILQVAPAFSNFSKFANTDGDLLLVGASGLKPYLPFSPETGQFAVPNKSVIKGWLTGMGGKSSTPGGPTATSTYYSAELPKLEVQLAKELNAHVVKATYHVQLGSAKAETSHVFKPGDRSAELKYTVGPQLETKEQREQRLNKIITTHTGTAFPQVGLRSDQTRIAFRTPNGKGGGQSIRKAGMAPAKDGDVVLTLATPLLGGTGYFTLKSHKESNGLWALATGPDAKYTFVATLADPEGYRDEVVAMVKVAQHDLLALVKQ